MKNAAHHLDRPERSERSEGAERSEALIAVLLSYGTALASAIIAAGLCLNLLRPHGLLHHGVTGTHVMQAGVALFILLPITRVALMIVIFLREQDFAYAAIAVLVLAIMGAGFLIAW